jgi:DNA-binding winged helix-turn-helix (wHTH) protein/tetratricopeptide (TPR) repeat protein
MTNASARLYRFGPYVLDPVRRVLLRDEAQVPLPSKAFDLLLVLVQQCGKALHKAELIHTVWSEAVVDERNLTQTVFVIRKALGERPTEHRYVVTIPGFGYRFVASVVEEDRPSEDPHPPPSDLSTGAGTLRSIAVLPFTGLASAAGEEYLELGIADALITKLGGIRQMIVRPTTAVLKYHGQHHNRMLAGRELQVDAIVDGTIQRSGARIRVAVHINRTDGASLWAGTFDEDLTNLFAVEDSIADQVARALMLTLSEDDRIRLAKRSTESTEAYHAYLNGRFFWNKRTEAGLRKAVTFFQSAIDQDPRYANAYVGLADCYNLLSTYGAIAPKEGYPRASAAALEALQIDDRLAEAHTSLAYATLHFAWDWEAAGRAFGQALSLNSNYATAHQWYAAYLTALGQFSEARAEINRALHLDPVSLIINADLGWLLFFARAHDEAIEQLHKTIDMDQNFAIAHWLLGLNYEQKGMSEEAIAEFERAAVLAQNMPFALASLGHALARSGHRARAIATREQLLDLAERRYVSPHSIAIIHAGLNQPAEVIEWLTRACDERSDRLVFLNVDPVFDNLRADPRFQSIVERVGLLSRAPSTVRSIPPHSDQPRGSDST